MSWNARAAVATRVSGHARQRPFERQRLLHPLARNTSPLAEMQAPKGRQRPAQECGVPGAGRRLNGPLRVCEAFSVSCAK